MYSNPPVPGSAAVLRALSAAILRCTSSRDADAGEVSAAAGLLTGSGFDLVPRPADLSFPRVRVRTKSWTPLPVTWTPHFPASISAMSRYVRPLLRSSSMNSRYGSRRERGGLIGSSARIFFRSVSMVVSLGGLHPNYSVTPDVFLDEYLTDTRYLLDRCLIHSSRGSRRKPKPKA